jgi:hypothetical protein
MQQSTMKDIKKMFAKEHVTVIGSLFGMEYIDNKTGKRMSKRRALKILAGDY